MTIRTERMYVMSKQLKLKVHKDPSDGKKGTNPVLRYVKDPEDGVFAKESLGLGLAQEERQSPSTSTSSAPLGRK
jgi:hypothetical protein